MENQLIHLKKLQVIWIIISNVKYVENRAFRNMTFVTEISLYGNLIAELPSDLFLDTPSLDMIDLGSNKLKVLQTNLFSNLKFLKTVRLYDNQLTSIEQKCFSNVPLLNTLQLSSNKLTNLSLNIMDNSNSLKVFTLYGNPWSCDSALCGVMQAVVNRGLGDRWPIPKCVTPQSLQGKRWSELEEHDLLRQCSAPLLADTQLRNFTVTCPPLISSSVDVNCMLAGSPVNCSQPLAEGAMARSTCKHFYMHTYDQLPMSTCTGGSWDNPLLRCTAECGEVVSDGETFVVNGHNAKKGEFPWHIGLYRLLEGIHQYQCGGSIISPLVIITAAHCFTDDGVTRFPVEEYYVGAGKYYSDYNAQKDKFAQKKQVKEYHIPAEYRGYESMFAGDLAVVVVIKAFQMTNVVQPVCVDWDNKIERHRLTFNTRGSVVGWGYVDPNTRKISDELKKLNAPYIDLRQCINEVPVQFRRWITLDKFCAGFINGSSVCKGDSGGGLVFKWNNGQKFYISGLASVGPVQNGTCDNFHYGVYTKISFYGDFILNIIRTNQVMD